MGSSKLHQRRHSRTSSVGSTHPRLSDIFDKNTLVPNNIHPHKIDHHHSSPVPNGTVNYDRPASPQKPKKTVRCFFVCLSLLTLHTKSFVVQYMMYMLWFNFILGLNVIFLCFKLIINITIPKNKGK